MKQKILPKHIAIIMDGNGRWAKRRGMKRTTGHKAGADNLMKILRHAQAIAIPFLTVYAFSTENWNRPKEEIEYLMSLPFAFLDEFEHQFKDDNIRIKVIGQRDKLPQKLIDKISEAEEKTAKNDGLTFIIALNYGGRDEIVDAASAINAEGLPFTKENIQANLYTKDIPDVDLMIRTSGEYRISNFLLWQNAYSELFFTKVLWPDFGPRHLDKALADYAKRNRRFGGIA